MYALNYSLIIIRLIKINEFGKKKLNINEFGKKKLINIDLLIHTPSKIWPKKHTACKKYVNQVHSSRLWSIKINDYSWES